MGFRLPPDLEAKILALAQPGRGPVCPFEPGVTEEDFQAAVVETAAGFGWHWYHTRNSRRSKAGFPDLVLVRARVVVAELKVGDNQPTAAQLNWLDWFRAAGTPAYLWRPEQWAEIVETLR